MAGRTTDLVLADFGLDPAGKRARLKRIGLVILSAWKAQANGHSPRFRSAYKKALTVSQDDHSVTVTFGQGGEKDLTLALMVEYGMGPGGIGTQGHYDVRKFLLTGGKGKLRSGKNGPYKIVPFSRTMADISKIGGKNLADKVAADSFRATVDAGRHKTSWGDRLTRADLPGPLRASNEQRTDVAGKGYTAFRHKSNILQGTVKTQSRYSKGVKQTTGGKTFRVASWAGDPWMHPGIKAHQYGEVVRRKLSDLLDGVI